MPATNTKPNFVVWLKFSFYPRAQMFMRNIQTSSFVDMSTCLDEVQPSSALSYIVPQQPWKTEVNIHPIEIPLHSTLVFPDHSTILILFNKIQEQWQYTELRFPLYRTEKFQKEITVKPLPPKTSLEQLNRGWQRR